MSTAEGIEPGVEGMSQAAHLVQQIGAAYGAPGEALEFQWLDPSTLAENPLQAWVHPAAQREALAAAIDQAGWAGCAVLNRTTGHLIDGHLRREEAMRRGERLPTLVGSWTEAQEHLLISTINPLALLVQPDPGRLEELHRAFEADMAQGLLERDPRLLAALELNWGELSSATNGGRQFREDEDTIPEHFPARTSPGELWALGDHRLIVGDCTDPAVLRRVLCSLPGAPSRDQLPARPMVLATDPPYGVNYAEKAQTMHRLGFGHQWAHRQMPISGDVEGPAATLALWKSAFGAIFPMLADHAAIYVWHAGGRDKFALIPALVDLGMLYHQSIIWRKNGFVIGRQDYQNAHEECAYGWLASSRPPFVGDKSQDTVWEISRDVHPLHPTQKPVALYEPPILNHAPIGSVILDPFAGAGAAIIAAEKHSRRAAAVELYPPHADTILARFELLTGQECRLVTAD